MLMCVYSVYVASYRLADKYHSYQDSQSVPNAASQREIVRVDRFSLLVSVLSRTCSLRVYISSFFVERQGREIHGEKEPFRGWISSLAAGSEANA